MREAFGDLWDIHAVGHWICITTNGSVKKNGAAVMGRGCALQAKMRFPNIDYEIGNRITHLGLCVQVLRKYRIITFPVKYIYSENADLKLIQRSCGELMSRIKVLGMQEVFLPRPGCGNGKLDWHDVRDAIFERLDNRVVVITHAEEK